MIRLFFSMILALVFSVQVFADDSIHCKVSDTESVDVTYNSTTKKEVMTYHKANSPDVVSDGQSYRLLSHDDLLNTPDGKEIMGIAKDAPKEHPVVKTQDIAKIDSVAMFLVQKKGDAGITYLKYSDKDKNILGTFGVVGWTAVFCDGKNDY